MLARARKFCRYQVDSGWAWVVCFASFFGHFVLFGTIQSFGTLFISLLNDFKSGESATAWVGSLGYGFLFVIGPFTAILCEHFGCRVMACTGSVLTTLSLLVTSFAPSISSMYFTFGVLWGTGGSFLFFSGLLILRFYFNRNISLANGITMTGAGFGTLIFNVMLQELDEKYGWRGGMRVLSVFAALTFLCGCAYIPPPADYLPFERPSLMFRLKRVIDPRPWKERAFTMWVVALCFILFAYFFPYTYLVRMALTLGIPVSQGALLMGYFSISAIFGKLLCGRLADLPRVRRLYIFVISATILSLSSMCVTAAKTYHGLIAYTLVAGFFDGCFVVTVPLITQDIVGKELMAKALGNQYGVVAFPLTLGPPVLGELYRATNSFTTAFFVSAGCVLVGVSLIYIVQRLRPDLVRRQEPTRQEVFDPSLIPSASIHSASVVDTLSGLFVTENVGLSASNLDPMEIGSYQRFGSFRRDDSRAGYVEPAQGRLANPTEIEAVYRQAVDSLSTTSRATGLQRDRSDTGSISKANAPEQSGSGSVFSGSVQSSTGMQIVNDGSFPDLQNTSEAISSLTKASESCATLVSGETGRSLHADEGGIGISGEGKMVQEGDQLSVTPEKHGASTSPVIETQTALEAPSVKKPQGGVTDILTEPHSLHVELKNEELNSPEPMTTENRDMELEVEFIPTTENVGLNEEDILQDSSGSMRIPVVTLTPPKMEEDIEAQVVNDVLEIVRIPPPPGIPRTGQLVALESEETEDQKTTSPSEIKLDTDKVDHHEREEAADNASCGDRSTSKRKKRLHLAIIDQLNLLSERLEAVAARQIQEEEQEEGGQPDQRSPFSSALQSWPLTPLYSANPSVPLTPVRARSSFLNTPAPTPRQTPPSAFLTTAPTPIHTPRTPAQGLSGICTPNDVSGDNPWDDIVDVCSPSPSQGDGSKHRSRSSSYSEVGQDLVLNEWNLRDPQGSNEAFSSKLSNETNSLVSNSTRSLADLNSVSEPIDITISESHRAHVNSPENVNLNQQMESSAAGCLPQKPHVQYENTHICGQGPFLRPSLAADFRSTVELQTNQVSGSYQVEETLAQEVPRIENFNIDLSLPQLNTTEENEMVPEIPVELKPEAAFDYCRPESASIPQLEFEKISNTNTASEAKQPFKVIAGVSEIQMKQPHFDPCPPGPKLNQFLASEQNDVPFSSPFQSPSDGVPDGSQDPSQIHNGLVSQEEVPLPVHQSAGIPIEQSQVAADQTSTSLSPPATDSYCQQVMAQQSNFIGENLPIGPEGPEAAVINTSIPSKDATEKIDQQLSDQSTWTRFFPSQEVLIFEMDTESGSSTDSGTRIENSPGSVSRDSTIDSQNRIAEQDGLFPPLQMFSDIMDITASDSSRGATLKLPPPPRQVHRKRMDIPDFAKTAEQICPPTTGKDDESKQTSLVDTQMVKKTDLVLDTKIGVVHESQGTSIQGGNVDSHPVSSDEDHSATGFSLSEIESDLQTDNTLYELTQKLSLSDNSICQEFELIKKEEEIFASEDTESSNLDKEMALASIHDDFEPLLVQNDEPIIYVNLGDLPEGCNVLQKRPSTTSSTDGSSTSTDSSLSENEMPAYSKLHEDIPEQE